jgi:hypothetical protein
MAITHAAGVRDNFATVVKDAVAVGAGTAKLQLRDGVDAIVEFNLPNPAFAGPVNAVLTLNGTPIAATAIDDGPSVDSFRILDRAGSLVLSGSVTMVGMGGDIEVTNVNVANGQDCSLESLTYEAAP